VSDIANWQCRCQYVYVCRMRLFCLADKMVNAKGAELRRALFSLKRMFQVIELASAIHCLPIRPTI